ncbi:MAG: hypothetical protein GXY82_02035 [Methanospirillum sp.]|nr:hypothetical protein [Methanospirillum sp.]
MNSERTPRFDRSARSSTVDVRTSSRSDRTTAKITSRSPASSADKTPLSYSEFTIVASASRCDVRSRYTIMHLRTERRGDRRGRQ